MTTDGEHLRRKSFMNTRAGRVVRERVERVLSESISAFRRCSNEPHFVFVLFPSGICRLLREAIVAISAERLVRCKPSQRDDGLHQVVLNLL
jgi:hypothetical protein